MTYSHRSKVLLRIPVAATAIFLGLLAPSSIPAFQNSVAAPQRALAANDAAIAEPPAIAPNVETHDLPSLLPAPSSFPKSTEVDAILRRADDRYIAGQRAYQQGDMDVARQEFNRAIDILMSAPEQIADRQRIEKHIEWLTEAVYRYDVNGLGAGEDSDKVSYDKSPLDNGILELTFPIDPRLKVQVKEEIVSTHSELPLESNDSVLSYIHYLSTDRGRKMLSYGMKRSGKYRPMIQRVLDEEGVPQELIYLAQIESAFFPRAVSRKKCVGMWQFAAFRGKQYDLNQNQMIDERMDPEKSTRAAAKHLHDLYSQFGDWYLAMAAYNCGPYCVERAVQRTGYADFWKLRDIGALPKETTNYVPVIVAITIMMKNAKDYGLDNIEMEPALEYETVKLDAPANLALIADSTERPITEIRELNPALLRGVAPQDYELHVPKGAAKNVAAAFEVVPANKRASWRVHKVEAGETLAAIAKRYKMAPLAIAAVNKDVGDNPITGQMLVVPAAYQEPAPAKLRAASARKSTATASRKTSKGRTTARTATAKRKPGTRRSTTTASSKKPGVKMASLR